MQLRYPCHQIGALGTKNDAVGFELPTRKEDGHERVTAFLKLESMARGTTRRVSDEALYKN